MVGTSHLESLNQAKARKEQMEVVEEVLGDNDGIFMGDFNFGFDWEAEKDTLSKFTISKPLTNSENIDREIFEDMWETLRDQSEESYTM